MYPPRDDLMVETGAFSSELYEVMGNCFGLPDAPRVWYQKVHRRLSEKDFKQHGFDKCLYYHTDHAGRLRALLIVHVDDFLCTYHEDFDSEILRDMFVWGSVTIVEPDSPGTYRGKEINKVAKEDKFVFTVTQVAFIDGLTSGSEFRSLAGSIQWLASQTRPEVAAVVSLSNRGSETTVTDLKSTLAAEASAADEGADRAAFANMCLSELLYNEPAFKVGCKLNGRHVTDAKSLYDCVVAENPNVSDK
ncbi:CML10, partial [Symbiodinium sp. KB8]